MEQPKSTDRRSAPAESALRPAPRGPAYNLTRSKRLHAAVAERLVADPGPVLDRARANLATMRGASPRSEPYLSAWERLLVVPPDELARKLVEDSDEMDELRHNTVFAGVLPPKVRWAIYREHRSQWAAAHAP